MAVLKQKQAVWNFKAQKRWTIHGFGFQRATQSCEMQGFCFIKAQKRWEIHSRVKCIVLVLSRPENTVNHMVLAFTQPQDPIKYMVLASSKPISQRRISKLPYAKGGCPNYHMQRRMSKLPYAKGGCPKGVGGNRGSG